MTAPIGTHVGEVCEAMWNTMVQLGLVWICLRVGLRDTLGNDLGVALLVTSVLAIRALHSSSILEKLAAEGAAHNVVKLLLDEFVTILLHHFFFALTDSTFSAKPSINSDRCQVAHSRILIRRIRLSSITEELGRLDEQIRPTGRA